MDKEFSALLPPATVDEDNVLERLMLQYGFDPAFPIVVWKGKGVIVDGHRRYQICVKHNIPFEIYEQEFESRDAVLKYIINGQLGRGNLNELSKTYLSGKKSLLKSGVENCCKKNVKDEAATFFQSVNKIAANNGITPDALFSEMIKGSQDYINKLAAQDNVTQKRVVEDIMNGNCAWRMCFVKQKK